MKRDGMTARIHKDLEHIPRGDDGQNELRMLYTIHLQRDLARDPTSPRRRTLDAAVASARRQDPGFVPIYDLPYFSGGSVEGASSLSPGSNERM